MVSRFSLEKIVGKLARRDDAVLVRQLAREIYPSLLFGSSNSAASQSRQAGLSRRQSVRNDLPRSRPTAMLNNQANPRRLSHYPLPSNKGGVLSHSTANRLNADQTDSGPSPTKQSESKDRSGAPPRPYSRLQNSNTAQSSIPKVGTSRSDEGRVSPRKWALSGLSQPERAVERNRLAPPQPKMPARSSSS